MTKKSHVRVVISDNLEREMAKKYPQHILFYLLQEGNCEWEWESEWYGMVSSQMGQNGLARQKKAGRTHLENVGKCAAISQRHDKDSNCNLDKGCEAREHLEKNLSKN